MKKGQKNPIAEIDPCYPPVFFALLWSVSTSTVTRWFQDHPRVLKLSEPNTRGRSRCELRIPLSVAMAEYERRCEMGALA